MAAGEVSRRREGETAEENETRNVKRRKLEEEAETRMILSPFVEGTHRGGIVPHASETSSVVIVRRRDSPSVEEECHQFLSVECDLLDSASSSSVSCCSSNNRSEEKSKRRMDEVKSCRIKKQKKRCETVREAELEDFFQAAEKSLLLESSTKYSFDFEKDEPLFGRYEWMKLNP